MLPTTTSTCRPLKVSLEFHRMLAADQQYYEEWMVGDGWYGLRALFLASFMRESTLYYRIIKISMFPDLLGYVYRRLAGGWGVLIRAVLTGIYPKTLIFGLVAFWRIGYKCY